MINLQSTNRSPRHSEVVFSCLVMAGKWYLICFQTLCVLICSICSAVPQWSNLPQNPQALLFTQTDQRFQKPVQQQTDQRFQKPVQQQTDQRFLKPVQQQTDQRFQHPVQQQTDQRFLKPVQQQTDQRFLKPIQQQTDQRFPQQFQLQKPVAQAEPLDKCAVADYEQIQCGQPGISGAECEAINCCFNGQGG